MASINYIYNYIYYIYSCKDLTISWFRNQNTYILYHRYFVLIIFNYVVEAL